MEALEGSSLATRCMCRIRIPAAILYSQIGWSKSHYALTIQQHSRRGLSYIRDGGATYHAAKPGQVHMTLYPIIKYLLAYDQDAPLSFIRVSTMLMKVEAANKSKNRTAILARNYTGVRKPDTYR